MRVHDRYLRRHSTPLPGNCGSTRSSEEVLVYPDSPKSVNLDPRESSRGSTVFPRVVSNIYNPRKNS